MSFPSFFPVIAAAFKFSMWKTRKVFNRVLKTCVEKLDTHIISHGFARFCVMTQPKMGDFQRFRAALRESRYLFEPSSEAKAFSEESAMIPLG